MLDIFDRIERDSGGPIGQYFEQGFGYYMYPRLEGELGPHMIFNGTPVLNWSLNNYLGLANHPAVRKADADAAAPRNWKRFSPTSRRRRTPSCITSAIRALSLRSMPSPRATTSSFTMPSAMPACWTASACISARSTSTATTTSPTARKSSPAPARWRRRTAAACC